VRKFVAAGCNCPPLTGCVTAASWSHRETEVDSEANKSRLRACLLHDCSSSSWLMRLISHLGVFCLFPYSNYILPLRSEPPEETLASEEIHLLEGIHKKCVV
jgi:hypothetical protein